MAQNGVKHVRVSPYHPTSNGQAERSVRVFKEGIIKMAGGSIRTKLARFLLKYRTTPHTTTGVAPAKLLMRRKPQTQLDLILPSTGRRVQQSQTNQKLAHDLHAKGRKFSMDESVYVRDFRHPKSWTPGKIVKDTGPVSAQVQLDDGRIVRRHQDHMHVRKDQNRGVPHQADESLVQLPEPSGITVSPRDLPDIPLTVNVPAAPQPSSLERTRPVRNTQQPAYLGDYVLT